jgi:hypothetical protein
MKQVSPGVWIGGGGGADNISGPATGGDYMPPEETKKPENSPAFPSKLKHWEEGNRGISLWDYYAAHAPGCLGGFTPEEHAKKHAKFADAMLLEREKRGIR